MYVISFVISFNLYFAYFNQFVEIESEFIKLMHLWSISVIPNRNFCFRNKPQIFKYITMLYQDKLLECYAAK